MFHRTQPVTILLQPLFFVRSKGSSPLKPAQRLPSSITWRSGPKTKSPICAQVKAIMSPLSSWHFCATPISEHPAYYLFIFYKPCVSLDLGAPANLTPSKGRLPSQEAAHDICVCISAFKFIVSRHNPHLGKSHLFIEPNPRNII